VLVQPPPDHLLDQVVTHQLPAGHAPPYLSAKFGVVLDVPAEDVADADVLQVEGVGQQFGLGTLAAALHAHDDVLTHGSILK
jgi:hypothetical protein